jgi:hypothetical protein
MPWDCIACKYQKHARYWEKKNKAPGTNVTAAKKEISFLTAGDCSSNINIQDNSYD